MSQRHNYFRVQPQKKDHFTQSYELGERLSKADFGVRDSWKRLPKWEEMWLIYHYQDWFDAVESMTSMLKIGSHANEQ